MLRVEGFFPFVKNKHTNKNLFKIELTFKGKNKNVNTDKKCAGGQRQMLRCCREGSPVCQVLRPQVTVFTRTQIVVSKRNLL